MKEINETMGICQNGPSFLRSYNLILRDAEEFYQSSQLSKQTKDKLTINLSIQK